MNGKMRADELIATEVGSKKKKKKTSNEYENNLQQDAQGRIIIWS